MSERSVIGGVQHLTKAFAMGMTAGAYAALPDRQGLTLPVSGVLYRR